MNQTIEKWLTVSALVGWVASIGSLVGLAIGVAAPTVTSRSALSSSLYLINRNEIEAIQARSRQPSLSSSIESRAIQQKDMAIAIPYDTSKGFWAESLNERSTRSLRWVSERD